MIRAAVVAAVLFGVGLTLPSVATPLPPGADEDLGCAATLLMLGESAMDQQYLPHAIRWQRQIDALTDRGVGELRSRGYTSEQIDDAIRTEDSAAHAASRSGHAVRDQDGCVALLH